MGQIGKPTSRSRAVGWPFSIFFWQVIGTISIELCITLYSRLEDLLPCQYIHYSERECVVMSFRTYAIMIQVE